jgi:hypothetical protein
LCSLLLVVVILRVKVHGRVDIAMPQHARNRLRIDLPLVRKPGAQAVTEVVKTGPLPLRKSNSALVAAGRR